MAAAPPRTWVLTSSHDNHLATAAHGFAVGQVRTVCDAGAALLMERLHAAAGVPA